MRGPKGVSWQAIVCGGVSESRVGTCAHTSYWPQFSRIGRPASQLRLAHTPHSCTSVGHSQCEAMRPPH